MLSLLSLLALSFLPLSAALPLNSPLLPSYDYISEFLEQLTSDRPQRERYSKH